MRMVFKTSISILALAGATACGNGGSEDKGAEPLAQMPQAAKNYASIVLASYQDTRDAARTLALEVEAFLADPTADTLSAAREAWLASREPYLQTEVYRFYEGPIDVDPGGPEGMINAWPLDELYIDYVADDDTSGIINDP